MRSYTWNCHRCRAIFNTLEPPKAWACRFCDTFYQGPPAFVIDGGTE